VSPGGFTLLELMTVLVIIMILAVAFAQAGQAWFAKAEKAKCTMNLKSLYVGATGYLQDQGHWPQIDPGLVTGDSTEYAKEWYRALAPYSISPASWVCPTAQRGLGNPDLTKAQNARVDYLATPFDSKPMTPHKWGTQPWFIEKTSSHEGGNLVVFEKGEIQTLKEVVQRTPPMAE
jgi:prepilin-type N-terminal cleavage/methylation domain-containing protein